MSSNYWCDTDPRMHIDCGPSRVIQMDCSFYGIDQSYKCPGGFYSGAPTVCYALSSQHNLTAHCNGQQTCTLYPNEWADFFRTDPCYAKTKYIYAQWYCIGQETTQASTEQTTMEYTTDYTSNLPTCVVNFPATGTCVDSSVSSVYTPVFNSVQEYFGYPVYDLSVCSGSQSM